jgi:hypothetical protein
MYRMRIGALALVLTLAACGGESLTGPDVAPRSDGGTYGGGLGMDGGGTYGGGLGTTPTETCEDGDGGTFGGGLGDVEPCLDPTP